jgi:biopolymer transport protein ExbD
MANFKQFMGMRSEERDKILMNYGVPKDSTQGRNEFKDWVKVARSVKGKDMVIAIKSDKTTPYSSVKDVMNTLLDLDENRYNLITSLRELKEGK